MTPGEAALALDRLRGLHLPGDAGAARGEVTAAAALGLLAALCVGLALRGRAWARAAPRRAALRELSAARGLGAEARLVAQARLLRRLARTVLGDAAASASGPDWAARLDAMLATDSFTAGAGRALASGLYRPHPEGAAPDPDALDAELARLIGGMRPGRVRA